MLVGLILAAEAALLIFGLVPPHWKVLAIFLNGLPLGMIWGLVVWYLEGRRTSEILLAALSCSFIVSSGDGQKRGLVADEGLRGGRGLDACCDGTLFPAAACSSRSGCSRACPRPTPPTLPRAIAASR